MILKRFFIFGFLFFGFLKSAYALQSESDTSFYCDELRYQMGHRYSDIYVSKPFESFNLRNLEGDTGPFSYENASVVYTLKAVYSHGTLLSKREREGFVFWERTLNPSTSASLEESDILKNFNNKNFITPRKTSISHEQFLVFQQNPYLYLEEKEGAFFCHDPFCFNLFLYNSFKSISAKQVRCFLRSESPSINFYKDVMNTPRNTISFQSQVYSKEIGFLEFDICATFTLPLVRTSERFIYALNPKTYEFDIFALTHFPAPFRKQYILIKPSSVVTELDLESQETGWNLIKDEDLLPTLDPSESGSEDDASEEDGQEQRDPSEIDSRSAPENLPPNEVFPDQKGYSTFETRTTHIPMENLLFFSHHPISQDMKAREEEAYHHKVTHLQQTLHLFSENKRREREWSQSALKEEISRKILNKALFFECLLADPESDESKPHPRSHEFKESSTSLSGEDHILNLSLRGKLHTVTKHVNKTSLHPLWRQHWFLQEDNFQVFAQRCCDFLSTQSFSITPIFSREKRPYFRDKVPPAGYYLEIFEKGHTFWKPFSLREETLLESPFYLILYEQALFFSLLDLKDFTNLHVFKEKEDLQREFEDYSKETPPTLQSLTVLHLPFSPHSQTALTRIIETARCLSSLTLTGCTFDQGLFSPLLDLLSRNKELEIIDFTQSFFPERNDSFRFLRSLEDLIVSHPRLTKISFSDKHGYSVQLHKKETSVIRRFFYENLTLNSSNTFFLRETEEETTQPPVESLTFWSMIFSHTSSPDYPATVSELDHFLTTKARGLRSLSFVACSQVKDNPTEASESSLLSHPSSERSSALSEIFSKHFSETSETLTQLKVLDLSKTSFDFKDEMLSQLKNLKNLESLNLEKFFKKRTSPLTLKPLFEALTSLKLKTLILDENLLSSDETDYIFFSCLPKTLKKLSLSKCFKTPIPLPLLTLILTILGDLDLLVLTEIPFYRLEIPEEKTVYHSFMETLKHLSLHVVLKTGYETRGHEFSWKHPSQTISFNLTEGEMTFTPFNIGLFEKFLTLYSQEDRSPSPPNPLRFLKFRDIDLSNLELSRKLLKFLNTSTSLKTFAFQGAFQTSEDLLRFFSFIENKSIQELDFSGNNFSLFFNSPRASYSTLRGHLHHLHLHLPSLRKILLTDENGNPIEWYRTTFLEKERCPETTFHSPLTSVFQRPFVSPFTSGGAEASEDDQLEEFPEDTGAISPDDAKNVTYTPLTIDQFNKSLFTTFLPTTREAEEQNAFKLKRLTFDNIDFSNRDTRKKIFDTLAFGFPNIERLCFLSCFKSHIDFLAIYPIFESLKIQTLDLSNNDFRSLFNTQDNSYEAFQESLLYLFNRRVFLRTIIITEPTGERAEWHKDSLTKYLEHSAKMVNVTSPEERASSVQTDGNIVPLSERQIFIINPLPQRTFTFSKDSIYFLGSLENYLSPQHIRIQSITLDAPLIEMILEGLGSLPFIKCLSLRDCFDTTKTHIFFSFLRKLGAANIEHLDISGHIFSHLDYQNLSGILTSSFPFLRELSVSIPNRQNHMASRASVFGFLTVAGGVAVTLGTGGTLTLPYLATVAGIGSGSATGAAASGPIMKKIKDRLTVLHKPSQQILKDLSFFQESTLWKINAFNARRSPGITVATEKYFTKLTKGKIQVQLFSS